jgi:hypothetical protein
MFMIPGTKTLQGSIGCIVSLALPKKPTVAPFFVRRPVSLARRREFSGDV